MTDHTSRVRDLVRDMAPGRPACVARDDLLVDGLGYDSLALIELAFVLESEFGLPPIDADGALAIKTVGDVEAYVVSRLATEREPR